MRGGRIMRKTISILVLCCMIVSLFAGCNVLQKLGFGKDDNDELLPVSSISMNEEEAQRLTDKVPIHLYFANSDNTKLKLEVRYIPMTEARKSVQNLAGIIVKEVINGPGQNSTAKRTVAETAKLRSPVTLNGTTATVDLTADFTNKMGTTKAEQDMAIYSIVNSLTELREIEKVKFTIDGKEVANLKGKYQFNAPFSRKPAIISILVDDDSSMAATDDKKSDAGTGDAQSTDVNSIIVDDDAEMVDGPLE